MKKALIALVLLTTAAAALRAQAQDPYAELLKSDLKTQKVALITEGMEMTEAQSALFWPIYRKYDAELTVLNDDRIAVIKDYAQNFEQMTDAKADELTKRTFAFLEGRLKLQKKYYKDFTKALGPIMAARFLQIERSVNTLVDFQLMSAVPLVKK